MSGENNLFEKLKVNRQLLNALADLGFSTPTEIQEKVIPAAQAGHDLLGIAQTGTGKTFAFLIPLIMKLKYHQAPGPRALILAPTRELVLQIAEAFSSISTYYDLKMVCLYGGIGPKTQLEELEKGSDLIISTTGRFLDLYQREAIATKGIKTLILDEADKMMDMGFLPQIRSILEIMPRKRQNMLFSATMSDRMVTLTEDFLEFPMRIEVSPQATVAETIEHVLYEVPNFKTKLNLLTHLLADESLKRVIIFVKTKATADNLSKYIDRKELGTVRCIHANKGQNSRINAVNAFKEGDIRLLVSTDVTARGMDISMVSHVINFDVPLIFEDYVHRIGRTGRAHQEGKAITFANPLEMIHIPKIETIIREEIPRAAIPKQVTIEPTPFVEKQEMDRAIDTLRKKEDPTFQGAFHEKKGKNTWSDKAKSAKKKRSGKARKK